VADSPLAVGLGAVPPSSVEGSKSKPSPSLLPPALFLCTSRGDLELDLDLVTWTSEQQHGVRKMPVGLGRVFFYFFISKCIFKLLKNS
jgi:hypothetical protein